MKSKKPNARKRHTLLWIVLIVVVMAAGAFGAYTQFYMKRPAPAVRQAAVRVKIPSMPAPPAMQPSEKQPVHPETVGAQIGQPAGASGQAHGTSAAAIGNNASPPPQPTGAEDDGRQTMANREMPESNPPALQTPQTVVRQNGMEKSVPSMPNDSQQPGAEPINRQAAKDADTSRAAPRIAPNGLQAPEPVTAQAISSTPQTEPESADSALPETAPQQDTPEPLAPFTIQVGAYLTKAYADEAVLQLMKKGYDAYIFQRTDKKQRVWYLVRFGQFQDRQSAVQVLTTFKNQEQMDGSVALTSKI